MADRAGNVWISRQRELATMAHASAKTVVTVEKIVDSDLLEDPVLAAGTLPGFYVESIAVAESGCWPLGLPDHYGADVAHLGEYARLAATEDGFARYLHEYVHARRAA
jgi:glutaconate CoA-transferase subunit A